MQLYHYQIMVLRAEIMLVGGDGSRDNYFIATTLISSAVRRQTITEKAKYFYQLLLSALSFRGTVDSIMPHS